MPNDFFVQNGPLRLHCRDWESDGQPVLLTHAAGFLAAVWEPVAQRLLPAFRPIGLDLHGHGDSDAPLTGYRWSTFATDVLTALEGIGRTPMLAVGHSVGATATAMAAAIRPDLIRALVLIEPVFGPPPGHPREHEGAVGSRQSALRARRRRGYFPGEQAFLSYLLERGPYKAWDGTALAAYAKEGVRPLPEGGVELKCKPEIEMQIYENRPANNPWPYLQAIECPTLIVEGGVQGSFPNFGEQATAAVPGARYTVVPGAGHLVPMEQPVAIAKLITEFFADTAHRRPIA